ncbi:predicted protein [Arabidopsis lyrata subsp. lyrata]|uniref:Predicted protein n=1 Tax=Arabidopsis lyrata subsp. lyrata TaxID=81972 RepID=D7L9A7_ARALL|nr:predicted protein [Arabidopsis lyrata subsp. lyrata]
MDDTLKKKAESRVSFDTNPLKPLGDLLEREGLLTQRSGIKVDINYELCREKVTEVIHCANEVG